MAAEEVSATNTALESLRSLPAPSLRTKLCITSAAEKQKGVTVVIVRASFSFHLLSISFARTGRATVVTTACTVLLSSPSFLVEKNEQ
ncbi:hypothetical protein BaRGS_00017302 [Batillaria attramentaria]|uniref:Uncharacterized protein n=1 Tax=Batillaria attramentaria TaxID=370345 RepID=A0ABD0KWC7_9CAEN